MVQLLARPEPNELTLRVISAVVILPLAIAAIWFGGMAFSVMVLLIAVAMGWELSRLCEAAPGITILVVAIFLLTGGLSLLEFYQGAIASAVGGTAIIALLLQFSRSGAPKILIMGIACISIALLSIVWLRFGGEGGLLLFFWMTAVVVATDVGAYFTGRSIGGPKLAPRISPAKTWSGLIGGAFFAGLASAVIVSVSGSPEYARVMAFAGILAALAQLGDLIESGVKRQVGVKDASNLIPGHGGVLDRLDGFLTVAPAMALMTWVAGGSPLEWQ
jgi:phosphatidate cytidylyltransferase